MSKRPTNSYPDPSTWPVGIALGANGVSCWRCELVLINLVDMHAQSFELAELASAIEDHIPECSAVDRG